MTNGTMRTNLCAGLVLAAGCFLASGARAEPRHGVAMFGEPALQEGFAGLPYANPEAPQGGRIVTGEVGSFDSLNPHILKGTVPWMLRFLASESLMGRNWDEPFSLYGLLAETIEVAEDGTWVEFHLRPEATFSDGSPVTVEDVLWSYETLGTEGHPRYRGAWSKIESAEAVGDRGVRFTFNTQDRELALIMGMRPILKKAQWDGVDFADSGLNTVPITSAPYVIEDFDPGRYVTLRKDPDYWGQDLGFNQGLNNLDEIRMEFFGDSTAWFEAFKGGLLTTMRETNTEKWATQYTFPRVESGDVVKSEIPHERPSGITGLVMNTRDAPFDDWRVRDAMIQAFNFEFVNQTLNGGRLPRITSYFSNSDLGMDHGPAEGPVADMLADYEDHLLPGALDGYSLPESDGTERNRGNVRKALAQLQEAGWSVGDDGVLRNEADEPFRFDILLQQGANEPQQVIDLFTAALRRLGIDPTVTVVDGAQYTERTNAFDFDMAWYIKGLSLSPGNEQLLYWGADAADQQGSWNWMGVKNPAIDGLVSTMLSAEGQEEYTAAVKALDRVLTTGRYVIPVWYNPVSYVAHNADLHYPDTLPAYGDWFTWQPDVWWQE